MEDALQNNPVEAASVPLEAPKPTEMETAPKPDRRPKKRPRGEKTADPNWVDPYTTAYQDVTFVPIPSTGRPGTPHSFFQESYAVQWNNNSNGDDNGDGVVRPDQMVHQHANGLVIVTAGNAPLPTAIEKVEVTVAALEVQNMGLRRKMQSKMMRNKAVQGTVHPTSVLANVQAQAESIAATDAATATDDATDNNNNGQTTAIRTTTTTTPLYGCVWGAVVEVNPKLATRPSVLVEDPLLDGYLAVVLPTGPFPPRPRDGNKEQESSPKATIDVATEDTVGAKMDE